MKRCLSPSPLGPRGLHHPVFLPCNAGKTVDELYARTAIDTFKVMGAMVTELDYGVGNVTAALER